MKFAISIPDDLFHEVERVADEDNVPRSKVFSQAIQDYLHRRVNRKLLAELNDAYSDLESGEEKNLRKQARKYYAGRIRKEKW
jgi:metal-responsive CopG/Arc/MetJ family transcriptional regulator